MSEHLSIHQIRRYHRRVLSPAELLSAGDHLAACGECRGRVLEAGQLGAETQKLWADLKAEGEAEHVGYEQLASYVNRRLDKFDSIIVESHLDACTSCAEDAEDLLKFSRRLAPAPARANRVEAAPPRARPVRWPAWLSATRAAAALLCVCLAALLYSLRRGPEPNGQNALLTYTDGGPAGTPSPTGAPTPEPAPIRAQTPEPPQGVEQAQPTAVAGAGASPRAADAHARAKVVVSLLDGGRQVILDHGGDLRGLEELPPGLRKSLRAALLSRQIRKPSVVEELYGGPLTLLGDAAADGSLMPLSPVGTVVLGVRPTFRWSSLSGASGYVVEVYDPEMNPVATSGMLTMTQWTLEQPLRRGVVYRWQVTALKGREKIRAPKPPAPEARFKVLDEEKAAVLADLDRLAPGSHLAPGVLYALAGLADDSEREFRSLLKENPRSGVAKRMLKSIRAWRQ